MGLQAVCLPLLPFVLWGVFGWWTLIAGVPLTAGLSFIGYLILRSLHRHVVVQHPVVSPLVAAQLRAKGLRPIPGTVRPALPQAVPAQRPRWMVVSVEKVPDPGRG